MKIVTNLRQNLCRISNIRTIPYPAVEFHKVTWMDRERGSQIGDENPERQARPGA